MPADEMAKEVGGFTDFDNGLGGNFNVDGEYLAFPYNIETITNLYGIKMQLLDILMNNSKLVEVTL